LLLARCLFSTQRGHRQRLAQSTVIFDASENFMATGKVAVVTAGGSGMGAGAARKLAADGFNVAILSSSGKGEALATDLGGIGVTGSNQSTDDLTRLVDMTVEKWGRIDVLVNSAGHGPKGPLLEISDEDWFQGMETYFLNVVRPTRLVIPVMQQIARVHRQFAGEEGVSRSNPNAALWQDRGNC
jgi:NAD(P)-dependent dehydrogenase (short-subunit alcohol dehydrogenase family)